jgi:acyl-CoA thioesterase-1
MEDGEQRDRNRRDARADASGRYGLTRRVFNIAALALLAAPRAGEAATAAPRILAFGDSLTAGYGLPVEEGFTARLQAKLRADGIDATVINGGVTGDTSAGGLARIDWALGEKPDLVILELGANDMLRGIDPKVTRANLDATLGKIRAAGAKVLLAGMKTLANWGQDYEREFDAIYPALAEKYGATLYPFFLDGVAMQPELNQADGLHPNAAGVGIIVARIAPTVERVLREGEG